jgi:hypothetical protein
MRKLSLLIFGLIFLAGCASFPPPASADLKDGLVSYWKLDETSGSIIDAIDSNTGTDSGATAGVAGKIETAYQFIPTSTCILVPDADNLTCTSAISISCWFYNEENGSITESIADKWTSDEDGELQFFINSQSTLVFNIFTPSKNSKASTTGALIGLNQWYHLVVTWDGTYLNMYINGSLVGSPVPATGTIPNTTNDFYISYPGNFSHNGTIDEVGLWSRALSQAEVTQLYNGGNGLAYKYFDSNAIFMGGD